MKRFDIPRILLGILFLFSGLAKSLNPYGFSVKVTEYLSAMGADGFDFLQPILGIGIPAIELFFALLLLFKLLLRFSAITALCLMSLFTLLTLWDLAANPVGDCGCFGDIIKLTPLESFAKNILLLALAFWNFKVSDKITPGGNAMSRILAFSLCSLALPVMVYKHLPLYDVSGYTPGTVLCEIHDSLENEGAGPLNLLYKNKFTGEICPFSIEDNEWQDSTVWQFVGIQEENGSHKVSETVFPLLRDDFSDVSRDVLSTSDSLLFVVVQNPLHIPDMSHTGIRTIAISAYDLSDCGVEHYSSDFSLLRQIMPNHLGGALLVFEGVILDKWAMCDCPYLK